MHYSKERFLNTLDQSPHLKEILLSKNTLETKRQNIRQFLSKMLMAIFEDNPAIPPLEWILTRDAITVFRNILSTRSERLAGYSLLAYLNQLINTGNSNDFEQPTPGFWAELEHLVEGTIGKAGVYPDQKPAFTNYEGITAAKVRSDDLSKMAQHVDKFIKRYPSGLDPQVIRRRCFNKTRILNYFDATELEWEKWQWQTRHIIRDAATLNDLLSLSEDELKAVEAAREYKIPFGITPYYLSLMDDKADSEYDWAVRAQVIPSMHYVTRLWELKKCEGTSMDFMMERDTSPIEGITRRYPKIVILKPILTCPQICVYCQRNWEIEDVYSPNAVLSEEKLTKAIEWIRATPEINEVLITGGDPLLMSNKRIESILSRLSGISHIGCIRIGTRTPVTLPMRINESLVRTMNRYHIPGEREVMIVTHFEHPYEITPQSLEAVQRFKRYGMEVYNQLVYTFYNSRKFEATALRQKLRLAGVTPYYTFNTKGKEETEDFRVPIARLLQEQKEEARLLPGTIRTDSIVFNVPRLGKNYLNASQHHDVISILPNGSRVYEFHPWEKKLSLVDTYVYTDVPIYDYLLKLEAVNEDPAQYKTIWYYY
jgi:lysine 2,3-aminomutase